MEGKVAASLNLRFNESKKKYRVGQSPNLNSINLITAANKQGWVIYCTNDSIRAIAASKLCEFNQNDLNIGEPQEFVFNFNLSFTPLLISVSRHGYGSVLLVTGLNHHNYPVIEVFDLETLSSVDKIECNDLSGQKIIDYAWHPNYHDSIVALCTDGGYLLTVAVGAKQEHILMTYKSNKYNALTCCWSPKGKNLALGLRSGQVIRLEPVVATNSFTYKEVDKSTFIFNNARITSDHQVVRLRWINRNYLVCVHAKGHANDPDTVHSLITVNPSKPYIYWSNLCIESNTPSNYVIQLLNLKNVVISVSSHSGEVGIVGLQGSAEAAKNDMEDWKYLTIDEEGARIELPLDSNNQETYPRGVTAVFREGIAPIIVFYASDGTLCTYEVIHSENILGAPEFQPSATFQVQPPPPSMAQAPTLTQSSFLAKPPILAQAPVLTQPSIQVQSTFQAQSPFQVQSPFQFQAQNQTPPTQTAPTQTVLTQAQVKTPAPTFSLTSTFSPSSTFGAMSTLSSALTPALTSALTQPKAQPQSQSAPQPQPPSQPQNLSQPKTPAQAKAPRAPVMSLTRPAIQSQIEEKMKENKRFFSLLSNINVMRDDLMEIESIHSLHREALDAIREEIDQLDLGMLENLYLIEYIRSRKRKSLDPITVKKIENIKVKTQKVGEKLEELNLNVDVDWQNYLRKDRRLSSLDVIYKTLATNQKIINLLKKKAHDGLLDGVQLSPGQRQQQQQHDGRKTIDCFTVAKECNPEVRKFLAARCTVPVRRV